ncbi:unnamed protein product [Adineta steineri]|nr:unnamed protein product [Adineta steineri]
MKHPGSFRATLSQIANEAYGAFLSAHSNMDQIQLYMQQIPGYVKTALKLLTTAPYSMLQKMLPTSLNNIDRLGTECSDLSLITYNKFADVELLLGEVIVLTIEAHGTTEQKATNASIDLAVSETEKKQLNNKEVDIRQRYEAAVADVKSAQDTYKDQLSKIPDVWEALAANVVGAVVGAVNTIVASTGKPQCAVKNCGPPMQDYSNHGVAGAESALNNLQAAQKRYDEIFLELMQHHDRITQVMVRIASLDMAKLEYEELIPIMQEAVQYLDEIKVHWGRLLRFFDGLRVRVKASVNGSLKNFVDWMTQAQATGEDELTPVYRAFYLEFMKEDIIGIHREAHLLYIMSRTYYDVSTEYLMDQLAGLNKLLVATTDEQRNLLKNELMRDTDTVRLKVQKLSEMRKKEYLQANQNRQHELEQFIEEAITQSIGRKRRQLRFLN